ncbi:hypothetical protein ACEPPN_012354 [Leptodophora sp. 'Broadleaf-Isolate-01']
MHNPLLPLVLAVLTFSSIASAAGHVIERDVVPSQLKLRAFQSPSPDVNVSSWVAISREMSRKNTHLNAFLNARHRGRYGSSPTTSVQLGQAWFTPIQVGGKTYKLLVDTGSSDTWIATKGFKCFDESGIVPQADCAFGPLYDPRRELEPINNVNFNIFYGDGAFLRGSYGMARVTLAGITTFAFKGTNYSADTPENQLPYNPIFTTMYTQYKIPPVFSLAINRPSIPPNSAPEGYLALGGLAPVSTTGKWAKTDIEFPVGDSYYINGSLPYPQLQNYITTPDALLYTLTPPNLPPIWQPLNTTLPTPSSLPPSPSKLPFQVYIDSLVTQSWLPPSTADQIASLFNPPAIWNDTIYGYSVPCDAVVPQLAVKIGGVILPWDKRDLIMPEFPNGGGCVSGVNNGQGYQPYTLGATFMRSNLVVYDVGAAEIRIKSRGNY